MRQTSCSIPYISDEISARINQYTYELLDYLEDVPLSNDPSDPMIKYFLNYALPSLVGEFQKELLEEVPDHHKKAIISCHIAAQLVYKKGLDWRPSITDILPVILEKTI